MAFSSALSANWLESHGESGVLRGPCISAAASQHSSGPGTTGDFSITCSPESPAPATLQETESVGRWKPAQGASPKSQALPCSWDSRVPTQDQHTGSSGQETSAGVQRLGPGSRAGRWQVLGWRVQVGGCTLQQGPWTVGLRTWHLTVLPV